MNICLTYAVAQSTVLLCTLLCFWYMSCVCGQTNVGWTNSIHFWRFFWRTLVGRTASRERTMLPLAQKQGTWNLGLAGFVLSRGDG
mmetsp:Transcript_1596/g.2426  ORF Transcript_1596/g.2426 Transcript_1596/m.2426 type:complete len:86 (-) Transcript_1596:1686-1943(-)